MKASLTPSFMCMCRLVTRGNHCSKSDLHPPRTILHPHHPNQSGAHELQTKDPGGDRHLTHSNSERAAFVAEEKVRGEPGLKMNLMNSKEQVDPVWLFGPLDSTCQLSVSAGRMFRSSGFYLHDHESHLHRTGLGKWTTAKSRRSLRGRHIRSDACGDLWHFCSPV